MALKSKKRALNAPLACLYHPVADPAWFTKENAEGIATCTTCHLHLVPETFKEVLVSGFLPPDLELDPPVAISAACASIAILWAQLNATRPAIVARQVAQGEVWGAASYPSWPTTFHQDLKANVGDAMFLEANELGSLTEFYPYLGLTYSNFLWKIEESNDEEKVCVWPKDAFAVLSGQNLLAFRGYLEKSRELLPQQPIWSLLDRLLNLLDQTPAKFEAQSLFGVEVEVETLMSLKTEWGGEFEDNELCSSQELFNLEVGAKIDPFGPDSPKRLFPKFTLQPEMIGPFDLGVTVSQAGIEDDELTLVHSYQFKLLVNASDAEAAVSAVRRNFFRKFGFTRMQRENQNWRVREDEGVDWDLSDTVEESWTNSRITSVSISGAKDWSGTAWQSRCS